MEDDDEDQLQCAAASAASSSSSFSGRRPRRSALIHHNPKDFYDSFSSPTSSFQTNETSSSFQTNETSSSFQTNETSSSLLTEGKRAYVENEEEEKEAGQCRFCQFYFQQLFVVNQFCTVECALAFSKKAQDLYEAYYAWALSCVPPSLQIQYSPKPAVEPSPNESQQDYAARNARALYTNARSYEIQHYRKALFEMSRPLSSENLSEFLKSAVHKNKNARTLS